MIRVPQTTDNEPISAFGPALQDPMSEGFYILVTGGPTGGVGATVATVSVTMGIEFVPVADFSAICNLDYPSPGQAT
jgi:hypothetical protein